MAVTANRLTQAAGVCAAAAGAIFIGVNINHPHLDLASITTDIGALGTINQIQGMAWLAGGLLYGIAMVGLGCSLWSVARRDVPAQPAEVRDRHAITAAGEATA